MPRKEAQRNRPSKKLQPRHKYRSENADRETIKNRFVNYDGSRGWSLAIVLILSSACLVGYYLYQEHLRLRVATPLNSPKLMNDDYVSVANSPERFWGTYRPHTYFGMKTRSPNSPVFGLMWMTQFTGIVLIH